MKVILSLDRGTEKRELEADFSAVESVTDVMCIDDINEAIELLKDCKADVAVFDLELFKKCVIETLLQISDMKTINKESKIVLVANKENDVIITAAFRFGINYVVVRPYTGVALVDRIFDLTAAGIVVNEETEEEKNRIIRMERITSAILNGSGILPNLKGYKYLKEAIVQGYKDEESLEAVTKYLYPEIAKNNNTTPERVERAIRHAIETAWHKCSGNGFYSKMGFAAIYDDKRPTNSEYIFAVVEYLKNSIKS